MSGQSGGFDDNPWITTERIQQPTGDAKEIEFVNPAKAFFDGMADFIKELDQIPDETPQGQTGFIMGQSLGELVPSTAGPNPALAIGAGEAQAIAMMPAIDTEETDRTYVQLIMDRSEGMADVAGTWKGITLMKSDLARALAAIAVEQCRATRSYFGLFSYDNAGHMDWPGPSNDYDGAIEYLLGSNSQAFVPTPSQAGNQSSGCQKAALRMQGGVPDPDGKMVPIDRAVTIIFTNTCYDWMRQHWQTRELVTRQPLDLFLREYGPVFYVGLAEQNRPEQAIPYFGGVMRNPAGGRSGQGRRGDWGGGGQRLTPGSNLFKGGYYQPKQNYGGGLARGESIELKLGDWTYFPGTMRLQCEYAWTKLNGVTLPCEVRGGSKPSIPYWPHEGVEMGEYFKSVMLAPDRADGMIALAGTFAELCRLTHPDGDYD